MLRNHGRWRITCVERATGFSVRRFLDWGRPKKFPAANEGVQVFTSLIPHPPFNVDSKLGDQTNHTVNPAGETFPIHSQTLSSFDNLKKVKSRVRHAIRRAKRPNRQPIQFEDYRYRTRLDCTLALRCGLPSVSPDAIFIFYVC